MKIMASTDEPQNIKIGGAGMSKWIWISVISITVVVIAVLVIYFSTLGGPLTPNPPGGRIKRTKLVV